jgi:hypothetical protein
MRPCAARAARQPSSSCMVQHVSFQQRTSNPACAVPLRRHTAIRARQIRLEKDNEAALMFLTVNIDDMQQGPAAAAAAGGGSGGAKPGSDAAARLQPLLAHVGCSEPLFLMFKNGQLKAQVAGANLPAIAANVQEYTPLNQEEDSLEVRASVLPRSWPGWRLDTMTGLTCWASLHVAAQRVHPPARVLMRHLYNLAGHGADGLPTCPLTHCRTTRSSRRARMAAAAAAAERTPLQRPKRGRAADQQLRTEPAASGPR